MRTYISRLPLNTEKQHFKLNETITKALQEWWEQLKVIKRKPTPNNILEQICTVSRSVLTLKIRLHLSMEGSRVSKSLKQGVLGKHSSEQRNMSYYYN